MILEGIRRYLPNAELTIAGYGPVIVRNNPSLTTRELHDLVVEGFIRASENGEGGD